MMLAHCVVDAGGAEEKISKDDRSAAYKKMRSDLKVRCDQIQLTHTQQTSNEI